MKKQQLSNEWSLNVLHSAKTPSEAALLPANIPITIPGDIASSLIDAELISNPYYGRNELDCLWIGRTDWVLSTKFQAEQSSSSVLIFDSIDTVSEIRLNGKTIGNSQNMFRRFVWDTTDALKTGENLLEVVIFSPENFTDAAAGS